jgi:hypothetical protein
MGSLFHWDPTDSTNSLTQKEVKAEVQVERFSVKLTRSMKKAR